MARDEVKIKVRPQKVGNEPEALEKQLSKLKNSKLQVEIDAKKNRLKEIEAEIESLEQDLEVAHTFGVDDSQVDELQSQIQALKEEQAQLVVDVDDAQLLQAKELEESLNGEADFKVNVLQEIANSSDFMNMSQGFTQARQGVNDLVDGLQQVQQAGLQSEQNLGFLAKNLPGGMAQAKQEMQEINNIVASMPGDDNTMRSVLSTAQALGNNLNPSEMKAAVGTMADYMQGSATMGKQALESQQDIMKYLLDGNTAELERGSIVSSQVDKLKQATTFMERQKAMQEVLNELGYGGIAGLDTTINKQAEWEGMMYNAQDALSSMWLGAEKGAMDYIIKLDEGTGHLLSMGIVAAEMAGGPLIDIALGLGQIGTGIDGLIRGFDILKTSKIGDFFRTLKTNIVDVASSIKTTLLEAVTSIKSAITDTLIPSLKSAAQTLKTTFLEALKSVKSFISGTLIPKITELATSLKTTLVNGFRTAATYMTSTVIPALKSTALGLIETGKQALISGYNALKSAALWAYQKLALVASTIAEYGLAAAQAVLNFVMSLNPIVIVVLALIALAAALIWAYQNVDWFREGVNNLFGFLQSTAVNVLNMVVSSVQWAINTIISILQSVWEYILTLGGLLPANVDITGNKIVDTVLRVMAFIMTLPAQLGMIFINIIAKTLGFGDNFVQHMMSAATNAVSSFGNKIRELYGIVQSEFERISNLVSDFVTSLPQRVWDLGASIVDALKGALGIGSPGHMFYMIEGEYNRIIDLTENTDFGTDNMGTKMVDGLYSSFKNVFDEISTDLNNINDLTLKTQMTSPNISGKLNSLTETKNQETYNINNEVTLNIGTVDNEDRIKEIVSAVKRELSWNNKTAGRTL